MSLSSFRGIKLPIGLQRKSWSSYFLSSGYIGSSEALAVAPSEWMVIRRELTGSEVCWPCHLNFAKRKQRFNTCNLSGALSQVWAAQFLCALHCGRDTQISYLSDVYCLQPPQDSSRVRGLYTDCSEEGTGWFKRKKDLFLPLGNRSSKWNKMTK